MKPPPRTVFFTGAGMSAESGVPTYRGRGGIWHRYDWQEYACQAAFERDPEKVLRFHELRRAAVLECRPHAGHFAIARLQEADPGCVVVTQNIDGMHQRAGGGEVIELHGSLWRLRCACGVQEDHGRCYARMRCGQCGRWLRPDITWFGDAVDRERFARAGRLVRECGRFVAVGTSGVVWPAAGLIEAALGSGARCVEVNPEPGPWSERFDHCLREPASRALPGLVGEFLSQLEE